MNRETYRRAFDDIPFSDDFEKRTIKLLQDRARNQEKEKTTMTFSKHRKLAVTLAAAVAALALSVSAAVLWLSPAQVAEEIDDPLLAQAFDGDEALVLNETAQAGEYTVTLGGLVSGTGISNWCGDVEESRTYAVVSVARTDGAPLTGENYDVSASGTFTITPLAEGYPPHAVNVFTLDGSCASFLESGVAYYLLDTQDIQLFADRTVYLAVYQGFVPSYKEFSVAEDGSITMREDVVGCMFTLPLDASQSDPEAARALVEAAGLPTEPMTDKELAALEQEAPKVAEVETPGGIELVEVPGHGTVTAMQAQAAAEYEAYMERESKRLAEAVENGTLSEEAYKQAVQEMEESLAGLWDGTRSPDWHANPDDTEVLRTKPSGAALSAGDN